MTRKPRVFKLYDVYSDAEDRKLRTERSAEFVEGDVISWFQGLRYIVWPLPVQTEMFVPLSITMKYNNALEHFSDVFKKQGTRIRLKSNDAGLRSVFTSIPENWDYVDIRNLETSSFTCKIEFVFQFSNQYYIRRSFTFQHELWNFRRHQNFTNRIYAEFEKKIGRTRGVILASRDVFESGVVNLKFESDMTHSLIDCDVVFVEEFRYPVPNKHKVYVYNFAESVVDEMLQYVRENTNGKFITSTKTGYCFKCNTNLPETKMDVVRVHSTWWHKLVVDYSIAFCNIFPPYVLLEILDWLPDVEREQHAKKIATIYSVKQSIEKIFENKSATDS